MEKQIKPPRAQTPLFKLEAQRVDQLAGIAGDGFGRADRFTENPTHFDEFSRTHRIDRLSKHPKRLVQATTDLGAEA